MMRRPFYFALLFSGLLISGFLGSAVSPVSAESLVNTGPRLATYITLTEPEDVKLGESFTLTGVITNYFGRPVPDKPILFTIDGEYLGQARSDEKGIFQRKFNNDLIADTYDITATFNGSSGLSGSTGSTALKILPSEVQIQTVPPIPGVTFQMDEQQFVSGPDGSANIEIYKPGVYRLDVLTDKYNNSTQRIEFGRWAEESFEPFRDIQVPNNGVIQVGLNVFHKIGQEFIDLDGSPVDPQRVEKFSIRSAQGDVFEFPDGQPRWIPASRIARRVTGLEETKLLYSVTTVTVDGSNVVNQSQQRFYTHPNETWTISLLLYSLHISAQDGLFGSAVGKSVNVEFPDGKIANYPLNQAGKTDIYSLARGNYYIELVGIKGLSNRLPVALSRNQEVNTKVITYLDLSVVGMLGAIIALGLLLYGRPGLMHYFVKNKPSDFEKKKQEKVVLPGVLVPEDNFNTASLAINDREFMNYDAVDQLNDEDFEFNTGVSRTFFQKMLVLLKKGLPKVGKPPKLSLPDQLLLTLNYLREHNNESEIALAYGVSKNTVSRTIQKINSALMKSDEFHLPDREVFSHPVDAALDTVVVDVLKETEEVPNVKAETVQTKKRSNRNRHKKPSRS